MGGILHRIAAAITAFLTGVELPHNDVIDGSHDAFGDAVDHRRASDADLGGRGHGVDATGERQSGQGCEEDYTQGLLPSLKAMRTKMCNCPASFRLGGRGACS